MLSIWLSARYPAVLKEQVRSAFLRFPKPLGYGNNEIIYFPSPPVLIVAAQGSKDKTLKIRENLYFSDKSQRFIAYTAGKRLLFKHQKYLHLNSSSPRLSHRPSFRFAAKLLAHSIFTRVLNLLKLSFAAA